MTKHTTKGPQGDRDERPPRRIGGPRNGALGNWSLTKKYKQSKKIHFQLPVAYS